MALAMTAAEIEQMKSGSQLDTIVAVHIFGYKEDKHRGGWVQLGNLSTYPKRFSTKIEEAWAIVEELRGSHLYVDIRTCSDFYEVWVTKYATGTVTATVVNPNLPEAICKAALLSVIKTTDKEES